MDSLNAAIRCCRERAARFLEKQVCDVGEEQYWRHSPDQRPELNRGHLLYGTWAGTLASILLRGEIQMDAERRRRIGNALRSFQRPDGTFVMPGVPEGARPTHDTEYFAFHCTNYTLGALRALGEIPQYPLVFMEALRSRRALEEWLAGRNWARPWMEGNNIVNLASFYQVLAGDTGDWAWERLVDMAEWHDRHQNPVSGFWHAGDATSRRALHNAMAGAAHNLHIYYLLEREVPRPTVIVDSCLRLGYMGIRSACIDFDYVDILVNFRRYGHRMQEVDGILGKYLVELLQIQCVDGGFCDDYVTPSNCYGYVTPARVSLTWTTWFRLATIGMVVCALWPRERDKWAFRDTVGMGYLNSRYAFGGAASMPEAPEVLKGMSAYGTWLATRRRTRFWRQRVTWRVRQLVGRAAG